MVRAEERQGRRDGALADGGQRVAPGTILAKVAQPDTLKAELRIPETQAKDVLIGQIAQIAIVKMHCQSMASIFTPWVISDFFSGSTSTPASAPTMMGVLERGRSPPTSEAAPDNVVGRGPWPVVGFTVAIAWLLPRMVGASEVIINVP